MLSGLDCDWDTVTQICSSFEGNLIHLCWTSVVGIICRLRRECGTLCSDVEDVVIRIKVGKPVAFELRRAM